MKHLLTLAILVCLCTFAHAQIPSYVPTNGLVGWWPFNGNANDESGNGNHGTVNGATLAADRFGNVGKAYSFDGVNSRIVTNSFFSINNDFSISIWSNSISSKGQVLFNSDPHTIIALVYFPFWKPSNGIGFLYGTGAVAGWINNNYAFSTTAPLIGSWSNIVVSKFNNEFKIYQNGILIDTLLSANSLTNILTPVIIGNCTQGICNDGFEGLLDDIAIYNRALTPAEVQQLYLGNSSNTPAASTVPGKINYQGLAVGANGKPIKNSTVGLRLSVLDSLPNGLTLYTETQTASTDAAGIFSTYLGGGTATAGTFANIPWANGNDKFLKVEMDAQGGTNYQLMGSTQLVSVPYAMAAGSLREGALLYGNNGQKYQINIDSSGPKWTLVPPAVAPFACGQSVSYAGESYPTVQIGTQCWFQKNVNVGTMINSTTSSDNQTNNGTIEKYCNNNDPANCTTYGGLYQWAEAVQYQNGASNTTSPSPAFTGNIKGICPTGWHLPSDGEYCTLTTFLDATVDCGAFGWSGTDAGGKMKYVSGLWVSPNTGATNSSGFSALPGGYSNSFGAFGNIGGSTNFWSSSEYSAINAIDRHLLYNTSDIRRYNFSKLLGFSARCTKD